MVERQRIRRRITKCPPALEGIIVATFWPVAFTAKSWYIMRTSSGFDGHSLCKVASESCIVFGPYHRFVATKRQLNVFFHVWPCHFAGFPSYNTADMKRHARTSVRFRDQKVAGSNPVTSTKNLSEDYNLQTFLLFGFARFFLRNPSFPDQIRIPADKPLFGFNRMTTDKGGFMELRVWFRCPFSVADVHWRKWAEKGERDGKKGVTQGVFVPWVRLFCIVFVLDSLKTFINDKT